MHRTTRALLAWYRRHGRVLPWRNSSDPYAVFISELMLQQTQVPRVIPLFRAWLDRFPTWNHLAVARRADIIHAWAGLGYNRRALYAQEAARHIVTHGVPTCADEWRQLKGVGPYMAAALGAFVNHERTIVIDTNVRRVIGRTCLGVLFPRPTDDERVRRNIDEILPLDGRHWDVPQALMDLASDICTPMPHCAACPLRGTCKAASDFLQKKLEQLQKLRKRKTLKPTERIHIGKKYPDRIYRGRILGLVRKNGSVTLKDVGLHIDPTFSPADEEWLTAMCKRLVADGLLVRKPGGILRLPES